MILLTGPISGISYENATAWRNKARIYFDPIKVIDPLRGTKCYLNGEKSIALSYEDYALSSGKCLNARSEFDVERSTIVLANFLGSTEKSVGSIMEIAWAHILRKPTIIVMDKDNVHNHPMIVENASLVLDNLEDAMDAVFQFLSNI